MTISSDTRIILPLENGDRLTRSEFERRYEKDPRIKKAELIEGIVYMASPLKIKGHGEPHAYIIGLLFLYKSSTPGVGIGDNATVRLDSDNEVQPDALLRLETGGNSRISGDDYIEGAPELIFEIAGSSASIDLHDKYKVYRRAGVREYFIWRVHDKAIDGFRLEDGEYLPLEKDSAGIINSEVFPGLRFHVPALLGGDLARAIATLRGV